MIRSYKDARTETIFAGNFVRDFPREIQPATRRKLSMLNAATSIADLKTPPGNRLEKLSGSRAGQWSIRVNDQYRICFEWDGADAKAVEVVDYH
jgi:proteic killer suppression protein